MTCRECKNYEECNKKNHIKFEIYNDGWIDEPHLCTYVECICIRFENKEDCSTCKYFVGCEDVRGGVTKCEVYTRE